MGTSMGHTTVQRDTSVGRAKSLVLCGNWLIVKGFGFVSSVYDTAEMFVGA